MKQFYGYLIGLIIGLSTIIYCNIYRERFYWDLFLLDICFALVFAYSVGLLCDAIWMYRYLKGIKKN